MEVLLFFVIVVAVLALLDIAALRWGVNSRPSLKNPEWETNKDWDVNLS